MLLSIIVVLVDRESLVIFFVHWRRIKECCCRPLLRWCGALLLRPEEVLGCPFLLCVVICRHALRNLLLRLVLLILLLAHHLVEVSLECLLLLHKLLHHGLGLGLFFALLSIFWGRLHLWWDHLARLVDFWSSTATSIINLALGRYLEADDRIGLCLLLMATLWSGLSFDWREKTARPRWALLNSRQLSRRSTLCTCLLAVQGSLGRSTSHTTGSVLVISYPDICTCAGDNRLRRSRRSIKRFLTHLALFHLLLVTVIVWYSCPSSDKSSFLTWLLNLERLLVGLWLYRKLI